MELAKCLDALDQERTAETALVIEDLGMCHDIDELDEAAENYFHSLDAEIPDIPNLPADCAGKRAILMKIPKRLLRPPGRSK